MRALQLPSRYLPLLLFVFSFRPWATAREKSDVVILKNGDRITCEIKTLARGMLTAKTDSMGTVQIKWQDVDRITSSFVFKVRDSQGNIYIGSLQSLQEGKRIQIAGGEPAKELDHLEVVQMEALEGSLWKRFSGSVDLGYTFTKAGDRTQFNFSGDATYRTEHYSGQLKYSSTLGTSNGATDADRKVANLIGTRDFSGKWLAYAQANFEHNLELQLDRRVSFLGGPGYKIQQSNRSMITAIGAAAFTRESYYGQDVVENAEGFFGLDAQFFKLYSPKVDIVNQFVFLPNFTTRGRRRIELNTKLRLEVWKDFFVTLTFYDSYDSMPPAKKASTNDYGFTTGLSWSFRR